ncbi:SusC/RagA family TonB-linked outer membrane protein [Pedobacter africanus]|nr:SusC/RagA family TonB-linked outer membrane protein [Pedobacter africanus]
MRLTTAILIATLMQVSASSLAQKITLQKSRVQLKTILQDVRKQSGYNFVYTDVLLQKAAPVTINVKAAELDEVLGQIFEQQPLTYEINNKTVVVKEKTPSFLDKVIDVISNDRRDLIADIRGIVRNERGEPLEGITVMVKGAKAGTRTNEKGEFLLKEVKKGDVLVFTGVAIETFEYVVKDDKNINLNLKARLVQLEEVGINTGYEKISKERFVGSYSQLDSAAFHRRAGMGILERLDGTVTGVLFNKKGEFSGISPIQIRGASSLGGGFGTITSLQEPLIVVDNFPMDSRFDINSINPNDIENVTVLKDAAASSIWGARAGNGVVVITTKRGKYNKKMEVSLRSDITIEDKPDLFYIPRVSSTDYIDIETDLFNRGFYNNSINDSFSWPVLSPVVEFLSRVGKEGFTQTQADAEINKFRNIDLRDELNKHVYQKGIRQQHYLSFNGGSSNINYLFSAGYNYRQSNIQGDKGDNRFTVSSFIGFKPIKNLTIQAGINYNQNLDQSVPFSLPSTTSPYIKLVDEKGNNLAIPYGIRTAYLDTLNYPGLLDWRYRPLDEIRIADKRVSGKAINLNFIGSYNFTSWLSGNLEYNYRSQFSSSRNHNSPESYLTRDLVNTFFNPDPNVSPELRYPIPVEGILDLSNTDSKGQGIKFIVNFNKSWGRGHRISALLGHELSESSGFASGNRLYGYANRNGSYRSNMDYFNYYPKTFGQFPGGTINIESKSSYREQPYNRFISFYGNASYTLKERYTIYGSVRRDGANVFGVNTNNKWKPLWSLGGKWHLSKEKFYNINWLSDFAVRGTIGYSGNVNNTGSGKLTIIYQPPLGSPTNLPTATVTAANNPDLKWEEVRQINLAIDFGAFKNRLTGNVDFFQKNSYDLIAYYPFDPSSGVNSYPINSANLQGKGFDIQLNSQNTSGVLQWNTGIGVSYVKTLVTKSYVSGSTIGDFLSYGINPSEGKILNGVSSFRWAGLDAQTGDPQGILNGQVSKNYIALSTDLVSHQVFHGSSVPLFSGFLSNSFSWKNFSFSLNITGRFNYYFRRPALRLTHNGSFFSNSYTVDYYKRWQRPGDELITNVPSLIYPDKTYRSYFYENSEIHVLRGDNIRLQDIRLQYRWNNKGGRLPFKVITAYFYPNNLNVILWRADKSTFDPDFSGGGTNPSAAPIPKTWTFGLNFNL